MSGKPYCDAANISAPILVIAAEWIKAVPYMAEASSADLKNALDYLF